MIHFYTLYYAKGHIGEIHLVHQYVPPTVSIPPPPFFCVSKTQFIVTNWNNPDTQLIYLDEFQLILDLI